MLNKLFRLTYGWRLKHGIHRISELKIGGNCGLCGKWMPDVIVPKDWAWDICDNHVTEKERKILIQYEKDKAEGKVKTVPLEEV